MKHIPTFEQFVNESAESTKDHEMAVKLVAKLIKENPEKFKHLKTDLPDNYGTQDVDDATNESLQEGKAPANDATIKLHINAYSSSEDPFDVATDIGKRYNWSEQEIEKAEAIIRKKYIN